MSSPASSSSDQSAIVHLPSASSNPSLLAGRKKSESFGRPGARRNFRASIRQFIGLLNNPFGNKRNNSEINLQRIAQPFRLKCSSFQMSETAPPHGLPGGGAASVPIESNQVTIVIMEDTV